MKKRIMVLTCCLALLFTTACGSNPKLENGEEVIASVDGKEISVNELYEELKGNYGYTSLISMIDRYIAEQEIKTTEEIEDYVKETVEYYVSYAESLNVDLETFLINYVGLSGISTEEEFYNYMLADYKVTLAIEKQVATRFSDEDIEKYYNENYSERLTVRHILIEIEESDKDGSKALKEAQDLIKELDKVDADEVEDKFIDLAKEYSADSSYANGGLIEDIMSSTVVKSFWDASYALKDGEYTSKPVKSEFGYHIIYRISKDEKPSLKDSKEEILKSLTDEALSTDELLSYVAMNELREKYNLKIYDKDIDASYDEFLEQIDTLSKEQEQ